MAIVDVVQNGSDAKQEYFGSHDHFMNYIKTYEGAKRAENLKGLEGKAREEAAAKAAATFKIVPVYDSKGDFDHSRFRLEIEDVV